MKTKNSSLFSSTQNDHIKDNVDHNSVKLTRTFTLSDSCNQDDVLFSEIMNEDLRGKKTPLELMHYYADILNKSTSHGKIGDKLNRLFMCGKAPNEMDGFYHGITISLKTGTDIYGIQNETREKLNIGKEFDVLQSFYGNVLSSTSPWAGKDFKKMNLEKLNEMTEGFVHSGETAYLGINSFRKDRKGFVNDLSNYILSSVIEMEEVPKPESGQRSWIHARGGLFIAGKNMSVDPVHPEKEVMALNYRWQKLGNKLPNKLLIDEIVEISDGLYLGKLYYATEIKYLLMDYDPKIAKEDYKYRNFGYFLLMNDSWLEEKNRLFPELAYTMARDLSGKFRTFRFTDSSDCIAIQDSIGGQMTILHYLQNIHQGIQNNPALKEQYFRKLHEVFMCGERPDGIKGFLHGGVVTFNNGGFLKKFQRNVLNDLYPAVRPFSPWTGKTFNASSANEIKKYIGQSAKYYESTTPVIVGTNTYRKETGLSLPVAAFIEHLDKVGMVVEYPNESEKSEDIYVKSFYFIASNNTSVNSENKGKEVLQFNYRWPEFHTLSPDNLCIDELVRIADGALPRATALFDKTRYPI